MTGTTTTTTTNPGPPTNIQAAGTVTPHYPPFVDTATHSGDISFNGTNVKLWTFSFLGVKFGAPSGATPGVNGILADKLIKAQRNLYNYACQQSGAASLTEKEFATWCWLGQEPVGSDASNLSKIAGHIGLKDLNHSGSKHFSGSAIDINLLCNPFVAGRTPQHGVYGETHNTFPDSLLQRLANVSSGELADFSNGQATPAVAAQITSAKLTFWTSHIWQPAIDAFDRASNLFLGQAADLHDVASASDRFTNIKANYDRFARVSLALKNYFGLVYGFGPKIFPHAGTVSVGTFVGQIQAGLSQGWIPPGSSDPSGVALSTYTTAQPTNPQRFMQRIQDDHAAVELVTVIGSCQISATGVVTAPTTRDPCLGFVNFRPEVVAELAGDFNSTPASVLRGQQLRWGCCMFGPGPDASGDVMHFDLTTHFGTGGVVPNNVNKQPGT
jgi:hypothetical protein